VALRLADASAQRDDQLGTQAAALIQIAETVRLLLVLTSRIVVRRSVYSGVLFLPLK
jgi:hypothetical protein